MEIMQKPYGELGGKAVTLYTLKNSNGMTVDIINYGGIIVTINTPDREGHMADVTLGYDTLEGYLKLSPFCGAIVGRHANRLEGACFTLNGKLYKLNKNEGENQLHGGPVGFQHKVWDAEILPGQGLKLTYRSPDGEEFYPGNLDVTVLYSLTDDNAIKIDYQAVSDQDTVVNLTNHAYFNLSGHNAGPVYDHELMINADFFTPINAECLPTGEVWSVTGTPMDFTSFRPVGQGLLSAMADDQMTKGTGYDHNWVLKTGGDLNAKAGELYDPKSGRFMEVYTTKPGMQFYAGNHLAKAGQGKGGYTYGKHGGLCLETQFFPNSMKHPHFPSPVLKAGQTYQHTTIYRFGVR